MSVTKRSPVRRGRSSISSVTTGVNAPLTASSSSSSPSSITSSLILSQPPRAVSPLKVKYITFTGKRLHSPSILLRALLIISLINVYRLTERSVIALSIISHHPQSKFRDAISGYSVDLNEDEASKLVKSKMSLYSSSLNILDGPPEDTQLAHSVLLIQKKKPSPVNTFMPISLSLKMSTSPHASISPSSSSSAHYPSPSHSPAYLSSLVNYSQTGAFTVNAKPRDRSTSTTTTTQSPTSVTPGTLSNLNEALSSHSVSSSLSLSPTTITSTTERSVNKVISHTLKPFPVFSSLNYAVNGKHRPSLIFRNVTQVTTNDASKDTLLKKQSDSAASATLTSNHRPSPSPPRHTAHSANGNPIDSFIGASVTHRRKPVHTSFNDDNEDDDRPVIVHSNHHQKPHSQRLKLTSVDYNDQWSTPVSFTEVPKATTTPSPVFSLRPSSSPTSFVSIASRPPLKVAAVHSNRQRHPDKIQSSEVTVIDKPGRNVTIVHQKLIVPYRPGRPRPGVSSVGTLLAALTSSIRPRPNTTETSDSVSVTPSSDDAEVSTYYPRPSTWTPEPPIPDSCIGCDATYPSVHLPMTSTTVPSTTVATSTTTMATSGYDSHGAESSHVYVTRRPPYPVATVNAILAPPMPSRPISTPAPLGNTGIFQSLLGVIGADSTGGLMSRLTLLKTALFTLLVMALPPLALIASLL